MLKTGYETGLSTLGYPVYFKFEEIWYNIQEFISLTSYDHWDGYLVSPDRRVLLICMEKSGKEVHIGLIDRK